jgi:hypothetical protein
MATSDTRREEQTKMTNEEILGVTVLNSWKLAINRLGKTLSELSMSNFSNRSLQGGTACSIFSAT